MNADQPVRPANIANIVAINQGLRPLTMDEPRARALEPQAFAEAQARGATVVDTRPSVAFGASHVPGSLNVHLTSPEFEQRVGWVAPPDVPLLLVVADEGLMPRAMHALAFVGLDARVLGYLDGGVEAWQKSGRSTATVDQISVERLRDELANGGRMRVLDVREATEWNAGHIDGAHLQSYRQLERRIADLPFAPDAPIAVICHSGSRSSTAASMLRHHGFTRVANVTGGMVAWKKAGLPMVDAAGCRLGG
jgi:hydroxyacylglutathione hydrolase